jgi:transcriptional regulator with XRE-family HTH domain
MARWDQLSRRQQLWMLDWQTGTVLDLVRRRGRAALMRSAGLSSMHTSRVTLSSDPLSEAKARAIEEAEGLTPGSVQPYLLVPEHDTLPVPDLGDLKVWEGGHALHMPGDPSMDGAIAGKALDAVMTARRIDTSAMARAAGMRYTDVAKYRRGGQPISIGNATRIAYCLGMPIGVFGFEGGVPGEPPVRRPDLKEERIPMEHNAQPLGRLIMPERGRSFVESLRAAKAEAIHPKTVMTVRGETGEPGELELLEEQTVRMVSVDTMRRESMAGIGECAEQEVTTRQSKVKTLPDAVEHAPSLGMVHAEDGLAILHVNGRMRIRTACDVADILALELDDLGIMLRDDTFAMTIGYLVPEECARAAMVRILSGPKRRSPIRRLVGHLLR